MSFPKFVIMKIRQIRAVPVPALSTSFSRKPRPTHAFISRSVASRFVCSLLATATPSSGTEEACNASNSPKLDAEYRICGAGLAWHQR